MRSWTRLLLSGGAVLGLSAVLLGVGAAAGTVAPDPQRSLAVERVDPVDASIATLQADVARVPGNDAAWAELGFEYVQKARLTADPTFYAKADDAFAEALALRPDGNALALAGQAALAAARHDFAGALRLADQALALNAYSATAHAVRTDALVELGQYEPARTAVQRLLDLRPGVDSFTRASYALELQGDVEGARSALERALDVAVAAPDRAFAQYYLGELAWHDGDLPAALSAYEAGLADDPGYLPLLAGRARVRAASGDVDAAIEDYRAVVARLPQPEFLVRLGELLEATGRQEEAEQQYDVVRVVQQLFAAGGQDVDAELALFEADHGSPAAAVAGAQKAHRTRPDAIFAQDAYAWALHAAGRDAEALPLARAAVRTGLALPSLHYHLGVIEAAAGEPAAARDSLRTALELNPSFSPLHAPRARQLLDSLG